MRDPIKRRASLQRARERYKSRWTKTREWKDRRNLKLKDYRAKKSSAYTSLVRRSAVKDRFRYFIQNQHRIRKGTKIWASCTMLRCPCGNIIRTPFTDFWSISVIRRMLERNCRPIQCYVTKLELAAAS